MSLASARSNWLAKSLRFVAALSALGLAAPTGAAVFWLDDRVPYAQATDEQRQFLLDATGAIECMDGNVGTGFLVDISEYVEGTPRLGVIATASRVLYRGDAGRARGTCAFRPAASPGHYMPIGEHILGSEVNFFMDRDDWAFATVDITQVLVPRALKLRFPKADVLEPQRVFEKLSLAGYMRESNSIAISSRCKSFVSDSSARTALARQEVAHVILHDCDALEHARGGPLAVQVDGQFQVVGIQSGSSYDGQKEKVGIPFDPSRDFFNYSRRLDRELENKLVAFLSRFTEVRSASEGVRARRLLILSIQQRLTALGFDAGPVDGLMGLKTSEAIRAFQTTLGISPTGWVSEELLLLLNSRE